jgi:hypothetical protein
VVVLDLLLSVIRQHHEIMTAAVVGSLPLIIAHIRTLSSYEPVLYRDMENSAALVGFCVGTHPFIHSPPSPPHVHACSHN